MVDKPDTYFDGDAFLSKVFPDLGKLLKPLSADQLQAFADSDKEEEEWRQHLDQTTLVRAIDVLTEKLRIPLSADEQSSGWNEQKQIQWLEILSQIRKEVLQREFSYTWNLPYNLSFSGIESGDLVGQFANVSQMLAIWREKEKL